MATHTVSINFLANATTAQSAINSLNRSLAGLGKAAGGSSSAFGAMAGGLAVMGGPAAAVAAGLVGIASAAKLVGQSVNSLMAFETVMLRVKSVVQEDVGDVTKNMEYLEYVARKAGRETRFSMTEAAEGLEHLSKAGYNAGDAGESLAGVLNMAQASGMGIAETAEKVADMMTVFGANASETSHFVDVLAITAAKSTTDMYQLSEGFKYIGVAGSAMGQNFENIAAAMGALAGAGVKASMAGTAIRGMLVQLADPTSEAHRELKKLGLSTADITPGPMNQLGDIMLRLREAGVDAGMAFALFGQRAGVAATAFTSFYDDLAGFNDVVGNADGAAQRMADTMDSGLEAATMKLKNAWMELVQVIGGSASLLKGLTYIVNAIRKFILDLAFSIQVLNNAAKNGELLSLLMAAFRLSATQVGNFFFNSLVYAFKGVAVIVVGIFNMLASPVFWSGMYQVFLASAYALGASVAEMAGRLLIAAVNFALPIMTAISFAVNMLIGGAMVAGGFIYGYIEQGIAIFNTGMAYVMSVWEVISMIARSMIDYVTDKISGWIDIFKFLLNGLVNIVVDKLGGFIETLKSVFSFIMGEAKGLIGWVADAFGKKIEENTKQPSGGGAAMTRGGLDRLGKSWDQIAEETKIGGLALGGGLVGAAGVLKDKAGEAFTIGTSELGDAVDSNVVGPLAALKAGFKPTDLFGEGAAFEALKEIVGRNMPKVPEKPPGEDRSRDSSGLGGGAGEGGRTLVGSARMATNLIMGRTINEVIATIAQKQLDKTTESVAQQKTTNEHLAAIQKRGGVSTFE